MVIAESTKFSLSTFFEKVRHALIKMFEDFAEFVPKILLAFVLLFLGFVIAKLLQKIVTTVFAKLGLDSLLDRSGVTTVLQRAGIKAAPGACIAKLLFWLTILFFIKIAAQEAAIKDISDIVVSIIAFLPNVITSALIMLLGFIVADIIKNTVYNTLNAAGIEYALTLSKIVFGFIFILVITVALSKINIQTELLNASVKIILAALGLALALSLGLGLRDMARSIVSGVYSRDIYKVGTVIEFEGEKMTIAGVGPVTTKLTRADGGFVVLPNEQLISEPVRGQSFEQGFRE